MSTSRQDRESKYDMIMKFIVIGNSGTGKSCILRRFVDDRFSDDQTHTIGVEFGAKIVKLMETKIKLQIWDTAGQERYRSVTRSYYRGAAAAMVVYDITCRQSFEQLPTWIDAARSLAGPDVVIMLVGNKSDADELATGEGGEQRPVREVSLLEASEFAQANGCMITETSAITGAGVEDGFFQVATRVLNRQEGAGVSRPEGDRFGGGNIVLAEQTAPQSKKGCKCMGGPKADKPRMSEDVDSEEED